jgi:hypothetical protein
LFRTLATALSPGLSAQSLAESFQRRIALQDSTPRSQSTHMFGCASQFGGMSIESCNQSVLTHRAQELNVSLRRKTERADIIRTPGRRQRHATNYNFYDEDKCRWVSAVERAKSVEKDRKPVERFPSYEEMRFSSEAVKLIYY